MNTHAPLRCFAASEVMPVHAALLSAPDPCLAPPGDPGAALRQHSALVALLEERGIACHDMPMASMPYGCYVRDSFVVTPWGLLLTRMAMGARRRETEAVETFAAQHALPVWRRVGEGNVEGGDVAILWPGVALVGVNGMRTTARGAAQVADWFALQGWAARIVRYPAHIRHLDVLVGALSPRDLLCCASMLEPQDLAWLTGHGFALHVVDENEALRMGCNVLNLGKGRVLIAEGAIDAVAHISRLGLEPLTIDISLFVRDSGGVHCLVQALERAPAQTSQQGDS